MLERVMPEFDESTNTLTLDTEIVKCSKCKRDFAVVDKQGNFDQRAAFSTYVLRDDPEKKRHFDFYCPECCKQYMDDSLFMPRSFFHATG